VKKDGKTKKNQKMRLARPKRFSQLLMLLLFSAICLNIAYTPCTGKQESSDIKEIMYIGIIPDPGEKMELVKNVELDFYNLTTGPPVNTTLPAFANGLLGTKCELISEVKKCVLYFEISHSSVIGETLANVYTDVIVQEFLNAFGYTGLTNINEFQNTTGTTIITRKTFGYLDCNIQDVSLFLKYKPVNGCFAKLINERLLNKYVANYSPVSAIRPAYILKKNTDSSFSWSFIINTTTCETFPSDDYADLIDVKELLNSSMPIVETPSQQAAIIIIINNVTTWHGKTYVIDIKEIHPEGYVIQDSEFWANSVDIKYEPLSFPIENITIDISINPLNPEQNPLIPIGIAIVATVLIASFFFVLRKKRGNEVRCNDDETSKR